MSTSLSSVLVLLPAVSAVLLSVFVAFLLARGDIRVERRIRRLRWAAGAPAAPDPAAATAGGRADAEGGRPGTRRLLPYLIFGALPFWWALGLLFVSMFGFAVDVGNGLAVA